jgi:hypothetical protein
VLNLLDIFAKVVIDADALDRLCHRDRIGLANGGTRYRRVMRGVPGYLETGVGGATLRASELRLWTGGSYSGADSASERPAESL